MSEAFLQLNTQVESIEACADFVFKWSLNAGLPRSQAVQLSLAVDELATDIVRFAYPYENTGQYSLSCERSPGSLKVILQEKGEPFEPELHPYSQERALNGDFDGAGLYLVRHLVDEFIYFNQGSQGKAFHLIKQLPAQHVAEIFRGEDATEAPADEPFTVSPAKLEDVEDLAKLIFRTWGHTYPKEDMYYPTRIANMFTQKEKFGVIARSESGQAIGYFAVLNVPNTSLGEVAEAVVSPHHRGKGVMKAMMAALIELARKEGLAMLFAEAITTHTVSQQVNRRYDFEPTALLLNHFPSLQSKGFKTHGQPRISVLLEFLPLIPRTKVTAKLPRAYQHQLKEIYQRLGVTEIVSPPIQELASEAQLNLKLFTRLKTAVIVVERSGQDQYLQITQQLQSLKERDYLTLAIDLPLDETHSSEIVPQLQELGFFLAGLLPLAHKHRDFLRMQMILSPVKSRAIVILSDSGKKIKTKVFQEYRKCQSNSM